MVLCMSIVYRDPDGKPYVLEIDRVDFDISWIVNRQADLKYFPHNNESLSDIQKLDPSPHRVDDTRYLD